MHHRSICTLERRRFLRWGAVMSAVGVFGCNNEGEGTITASPNAKVGKARLDGMKNKADEIAAKKKK
jgi:hypothetical protein